MKKFNQLYNEIIQSITTYQQFPLSNYTKQTIFRNEEILLQQKSILTKPQELFRIVKPIILKLAELNSTQPVKINIFKAINSDYCKEFEDDNLYQQLLNLFKGHEDSYFMVKIPQYEVNDIYGQFKVPGKFKNFKQETFNYHNLPKIQVIPGVINYRSEELIKQQKQLRTTTINTLKKLQIALQIFKKQIFQSGDKNFGTIEISVHQILNNDPKHSNQIKPSLDDVISHELQHFLIFLLSIAKTSISFGTFFCNNLKHINDYSLKPTEFFTLSRSYVKTLNKVFQKIKNKYSIEDFIKQFLSYCLFDKEINNDIKIQLNNIKNFKALKSFYVNMYKDQHFEIKTSKDYFNPETLKFETINAIKEMPIKRFNTLLKWTVKILKELNQK